MLLRDKQFVIFNMVKNMKTYTAKPADIQKKWILIDAEGVVLGRLASLVAMRLRGKHKASFTPHMDMGDNVIIINADKVQMTGKKRTDKIYYWHTGYPGGIKETNPSKMKAKNKSNDIIKLAIKRMIPKGPLGRQQLSNCKIYSGEEHSHTAQKPEKIDFEKLNNKNIKR